MAIALEIETKSKVAVSYLRAECGVRYWEDGTVNGEQDADGSRIPCRKGTAADNNRLGGGDWCPLIELATGKIVGWPAGTTASIHYKVCDDGLYQLLSEDCKTIVKEINGYVPTIMCPEGDGFGDYVIMEIAADGSIAKWKVDLTEFEKSDDDD